MKELAISILNVNNAEDDEPGDWKADLYFESGKEDMAKHLRKGDEVANLKYNDDYTTEYYIVKDFETNDDELFEHSNTVYLENKEDNQFLSEDTSRNSAIYTPDLPQIYPDVSYPIQVEGYNIVAPHEYHISYSILNNDEKYAFNKGAEAKYLVDYSGNIYSVEYFDANYNEAVVRDIAERNYTPDINIAYMYTPMADAPILTYANLSKFDDNARDIINNFEKYIFWNHRGIKVEDSDGTAIDGITKIKTRNLLIKEEEEDGWQGGRTVTVTYAGHDEEIDEIFDRLQMVEEKYEFIKDYAEENRYGYKDSEGNQVGLIPLRDRLKALESDFDDETYRLDRDISNVNDRFVDFKDETNEDINIIDGNINVLQEKVGSPDEFGTVIARALEETSKDVVFQLGQNLEYGSQSFTEIFVPYEGTIEKVTINLGIDTLSDYTLMVALDKFIEVDDKGNYETVFYKYFDEDIIDIKNNEYNKVIELEKPIPINNDMLKLNIKAGRLFKVGSLSVIAHINRNKIVEPEKDDELKIKVIDKVDAQPLESAYITINDEYRGATDSDGSLLVDINKNEVFSYEVAHNNYVEDYKSKFCFNGYNDVIVPMADY